MSRPLTFVRGDAQGKLDMSDRQNPFIANLASGSFDDCQKEIDNITPDM